MNLPKDPVMLLSVVNTQLRDRYPSLTELAKAYMIPEEDIITPLKKINYEYNKERNQFVQPQGGKKMQTNCDFCAYNEYDEEDECYYCSVNMDEDDMARFIQSSYKNCPYYKSGDEYQVVRHQMQKYVIKTL